MYPWIFVNEIAPHKFSSIFLPNATIQEWSKTPLSRKVIQTSVLGPWFVSAPCWFNLECKASKNWIQRLAQLFRQVAINYTPNEQGLCIPWVRASGTAGFHCSTVNVSSMQRATGSAIPICPYGKTYTTQAWMYNVCRFTYFNGLWDNFTSFHYYIAYIMIISYL